MIAVVANENEHPAVEEFFQLFKTAWRFHEANARCDVLICSNADTPETEAKLILIYGSDEKRFDQENGIEPGDLRESVVLKFGLDRIPISGKCSSFKNSDSESLVDETTNASISIVVSSGEQMVIRIGFNLFEEVHHLLSKGQPANFAKVPTLDLHIECLRELLVRHSIPIGEIPPVPLGYNFTACLTHDVDHPRVRDHVCDHTMLGFLYRAVLGSVIDWIKGRKTFGQVGTNLRAALSLPFVYLGIAPDFWDQFDHYLEMEGEAKSTFFVIPQKGDPGLDPNGRKQWKRAARYSLKSLAKNLQRLVAAGREIGVHGIDAWRDSTKGRAELEAIREITGSPEIGVRMHWLFFGEESPAVLEAAGYSYDSTVGYNDAIGYRAGTGQIFKPFHVQRLLELPLHVMDTAMFYPPHMHLSPAAAREEIDHLIDNAVRFGGVLTVNWHDRSIAPERLWDQPYVDLVAELKRRGAWMPTAGEAVSWFRERRAAAIEPNETNESFRIALADHDHRLPGFRLRSHSGAPGHAPRSEQFQFKAAGQHFNAA